MIIKIKKLRETSSIKGIETFKYFHKTGPGQYAGHDEFLGVSVTEIRCIIKENIANCLLNDIEECYILNITRKDCRNL